MQIAAQIKRTYTFTSLLQRND